MTTIQPFIAVGVGLVAVVVAFVLRRRRRQDPPTQRAFEVPTQLDRADFDRPSAPWLVVVFSSASCHTCAAVLAKARVLDGREVVVVDVEYGARRDLHERYRIDAVPLVLVADARGVVQRSFLGQVSATDLWAAVAHARDPGSAPEGGCSNH
jgi:hypothetical protein